MKNSYTGVGVDNNSDNQLWKMIPTTLSDEVGGEFPALINPVPNPFEEIGLEYVVVTYEDTDGALFIPAQQIGSLSFNDGSSYEVFISNFSAASTDGSMTISYDEDGKLTCDAPYIAYVLLPAGSEEFSFDAMTGWWSYYQNISYIGEGDEAAPSPSFSDESCLLFSGISVNAYSFTHQHVMMPGYTPVSFKNYTLDPADTWQWKTATIEYNDLLQDYWDVEPVTSEERDFTFSPVGGELYGPVQLTASFGAMESDPVLGMEDNALLYAGANGGSWYFTDDAGERMEDSPIITRANLRYDFQGFNYVGSEQEVKSLILYQGKPAAPLYFTGTSLLVYNFAKLADEVVLKCKIQKVHRAKNGQLTMGEVIAEADLDQEDIIEGSWNNTVQLNWNEFYVVDELGMSETLDFLQVDDEFALVFEGVDNDTFSGLLLCCDGPANGLTSTYVVVSGEDEYTGSAYWRFTGNLMAGFRDAVYGYMHTEDDTDLHFGNEGGEASLRVQPMFYNGSDAEQQTAIWPQDGTEIPEWLEVGIANEVYTEDEFAFDLVVKAAPMEGESYREAELVFEQWGSKLVVNVTQGEKEEALTYEVDVEQEPRGNYAAEPVFDVTEVAALLNADPADLTFSLVEPKTGEPTVEYTGNPGELLFWIDQEGNNNGYNGAFVYVGYQPADKTIVVCPHPNTANDTNGKAVVLLTNAEGKYAEITLNIHIYKEIQEITRSLSENVIKARVEYETTEDSHVEKVVEITDEQVNEILADLQLESLADAEIFGWNPTTETFTDEFGSEGFDGWRDGNGDFHKWTGDATAPACVKATDGKTYYCYNIGGCDPQEIKCYYAIANDKRAVLVEVTFAYVVPAGISEVNAADQAAPVYNLNGVRMQGNNLPKGVFIQNGKKIVKK